LRFPVKIRCICPHDVPLSNIRLQPSRVPKLSGDRTEREFIKVVNEARIRVVRLVSYEAFFMRGRCLFALGFTLNLHDHQCAVRLEITK